MSPSVIAGTCPTTRRSSAGSTTSIHAPESLARHSPDTRLLYWLTAVVLIPDLRSGCGVAGRGRPRALDVAGVEGPKGTFQRLFGERDRAIGTRIALGDLLSQRGQVAGRDPDGLQRRRQV